MRAVFSWFGLVLYSGHVVGLSIPVSGSKEIYVEPIEVMSESSPLRQGLNRRLSYMNEMVDGSETRYNEYAQAYRLLGLYVDCGEEVEKERRRLEDGEGEDGENDENGEEEEEEQQENEDQEEEEQGEGENDENAQDEEEEQEEGEEDAQDVQIGCRRYLLWAAYVDLGYEGDGLSYEIYDHNSHRWNRTACDTLDSERCVRLDCHFANSNFKLLGFFKQPDPVDWLATLIQHQGSCLYSYDDYEFMSGSLDWLPNGCTDTGVLHENGSSNIYFDLEPRMGGRIGIELFRDSGCFKRYRGTQSRKSVLASYYNDDSINVQANMAKLNILLEPFRTCQPCRTYNLNYVQSSNNNNGNDDGNDDNENNDGNNNNDNQDDDSYDPNNGELVCEDAAGYNGVNQCRMFKANTEMAAASFSDVTLASEQGTITRTNTHADVRRNFWQAFGWLLFAILLFIAGVCCLGFLSSNKRTSRVNNTNKEPLIGGRRT